MIPVLVAILYWGFRGSPYVTALIFVVASLTDFVDGYIARSRNQVTDFGKFMDPLADKVLTFAAMLWFTQQDIIPAWATLIVLVREFAVTALRLVAVAPGKVIAAAWSGKIKTAATMVCLTTLFVFGDRTDRAGAEILPQGARTVLTWVCVIVIVVTTVYSGIEYFVKNKDAVKFTDLK